MNNATLRNQTLERFRALVTNRSASIIASNLSHGGAVRAYVLAQALQKLGFSTTVVGIASGELYVEPPSEIPIIPVPLNRGNPIKQLLSSVNGPLLVAVKPLLSSFGVALARRRTGGGSVLLDFDDHERSWISRPRIFSRFPFYDCSLERWRSLADAVTTTSTFLQQRYGGTLLPNGNDTALFNPALYDKQELRNRLGLDGQKIVLFAGSPRPHKGLEDALEAVRLLGREDVRLVVIGPNPYDRFHEELKKNGGPLLTFGVPVGFSESPKLLAAADIVIIPQRDTPTGRAQAPLKLSAAMSMARPIVSTDVGDIPKIVDDTALICSPNRPAELADSLRRLLDDQDAAEALGARARARCQAFYSTDAMAAVLGEILSKLRIS